MTYILGISAFYHDSAAALIANDKIIAAAQEERFSRQKHDAVQGFLHLGAVDSHGGFTIQVVRQRLSITPAGGIPPTVFAPRYS